MGRNEREPIRQNNLDGSLNNQESSFVAVVISPMDSLETNKNVFVKKFRKMLEAEKKLGVPIEAFLRMSYLEDKNGTPAIAEEIGNVTKSTVDRWLKIFGFQTRSRQEAGKVRKEKRVWNSETSRKRANTVLAWHKARIEQEKKKAFGQTVEEQKVNFKREYQQKRSLERMSKSLRRRGIRLSRESLGEIKREFEQPTIYFLRSKPKTSEEGRRLVKEAREKGLMKYLSKRENEILRRRYPEEGEPESLEDVGRYLNNITRERARQIEKEAISRLKELARR